MVLVAVAAIAINGCRSVMGIFEEENQVKYAPTGDRYTLNGQTCQDFEQTVMLNGVPKTRLGTACKGADGVWRIRQS